MISKIRLERRKEEFKKKVSQDIDTFIMGDSNIVHVFDGSSLDGDLVYVTNTRTKEVFKAHALEGTTRIPGSLVWFWKFKNEEIGYTKNRVTSHERE